MSWLLRISSPGAQLPLGALKKINEIPEYKFLNIKVLGNSNKLPTLLSLFLLRKHYLKSPPCFLDHVLAILPMEKKFKNNLKESIWL